MIQSKVLLELFTSSNCQQCRKAKTIVRTLLREFTEDQFCLREINILDELDYAVELGILATPSIAINGKLVYTKLPSASILKQTINKAISK